MTTLQQAYAEAQAKWQELERGSVPVFRVGAATCGRAAGAERVMERLHTEVRDRGLDVRIIEVGCLGPCFLEPLVVIEKPGLPGVCYANVGPDEMSSLVQRFVLGNDPCAEWALGRTGPGSVDGIGPIEEHPALRGQVRNVLRNCGLIDPENVHHYLARDGYRGFLRALELGPEAVVAEVKAAGIRGRGGAGFPTGQKWETCRSTGVLPRYLICNADEGDPGAFMNRSLLESDPHAVLEGMLIAAFAIGASQGYIYCRAEYPLAIKRLQLAISQMRDLGLLGNDIQGSGFSFDVKIKKGAGAFVCGEETALIASIEGRRGMPRPRPPFPATSGLWGKPTVIQNVETLGSLASIMRNGAAWYAGFGTETSRGTKTFALAGKIQRTGLIEVPLGTTLKEIVYEIGGGVPGGRQLKGVQTGGPSGGCIPRELLNLPVDYKTLAEAGSIMGSGGMIVLDEDSCMVDIARYFLSFTREESCGKCPPCRVGSRIMLDILERICAGKGQEEDLERLESLAETVQKASLCGLGQTAPNPVLTTLRYFRQEYEAHIREKHCPAGVCPDIVHAPCENGCPAGVDVPLYISLVGEGRYEEALASHLERNPLPSICARVCPHPCEDKCRRQQIDSPVAIRAIKRHMVDTARRPEPQQMVRDNPHNHGKKIAVIGSGPAGLSCAYYLRRLGYPVTIFEREERPGGMLAYAIPEYRLPRDILKEEIDWILAFGIDLKLGTEFGRDLAYEDLVREGYRAFFLGLGCWEGTRLGIPGEDLKGVTQGLDFLLARNRGQDFPLGKKVVVIGGGDVAIDSCRMAFRMGADVTLVYRRTREEMPAIKTEIEEAEAEGVKLVFLAAPERIEGNGSASRLVCQRMKLSGFELDGRRRPEPTGEEMSFEADSIIAAIGQRPVLGDIGKQTRITITRAGRIQVDPFTNATSAAVVYAGGDVVTGPSIALAAIAAGERAACAINEELSKDLAPAQRSVPFWQDAMNNATSFDPEAEPVTAVRMKQRSLPLSARVNLNEVEQPVDRDQALMECARCLRCDYRFAE